MLKIIADRFIARAGYFFNRPMLHGCLLSFHWRVFARCEQATISRASNHVPVDGLAVQRVIGVLVLFSRLGD